MNTEALNEVERVFNIISELSRCVDTRGRPAFDATELDYLKDYIVRRTGTFGVGGCPNLVSRDPLPEPTIQDERENIARFIEAQGVDIERASVALCGGKGSVGGSLSAAAEFCRDIAAEIRARGKR